MLIPRKKQKVASRYDAVKNYDRVRRIGKFCVDHGVEARAVETVVLEQLRVDVLKLNGYGVDLKWEKKSFRFPKSKLLTRIKAAKIDPNKPP